MNLVGWLKAAGHDIGYSTVTDSMREKQELAILSALNWQLIMPNVVSWMHLFCTRISTLTRQSWTPIIAPIWEQSHAWLCTLVMQCASDASLTPRRVAQGLLCIGCVAMKLL